MSCPNSVCPNSPCPAAYGYCAAGESSGTVVPMTGDDKTVLYDSHDYDEVPMDESRSPPPPPPIPMSPSGRPGTTPTLQERPLPPINSPTLPSDGMYSEVRVQQSHFGHRNHTP